MKTAFINSNARIVEALVNRRAKIAPEQEKTFQVIVQQQAEIRVLQTETRRILDIDES